MRRYLVTFTMPDGQQGRYDGIYADGFEAVIQAMAAFPQARRIAARRLP